MLRNPHLDAALFACGSMVLNYPLYAFFRAMRGKTAHKRMPEYHAAAGKKHRIEIGNNATA